MHKSAVSAAALVGAALAALAQPAALAAADQPPVDRAVIISNAATGFYLQTDAQNENRPQRVQVWYPWPLANGGSGAVWRLHETVIGQYTIETEPIQNPAPACLTVPDNAKSDVPLEVRDCDGGPAQSWRVRQYGTSDTYTVTPAGPNFRSWAITTRSQVYASGDAYVALKHFTGADAPTLMRWKIDPTRVPPG